MGIVLEANPANMEPNVEIQRLPKAVRCNDWLGRIRRDRDCVRECLP